MTPVPGLPVKGPYLWRWCSPRTLITSWLLSQECSRAPGASFGRISYRHADTGLACGSHKGVLDQAISFLPYLYWPDLMAHPEKLRRP